MAPKRSKTTKSASSVRLYSSLTLTLRGPYRTPLLGPHYHQAKPKNLLALDTRLVRAPFSYGLEDIDWGSWDANLEQLGSNPDVTLPEGFLPWADWVDAMLPLFRDKWMLKGIFHAIMLSKHQVVLNPSLIGAALCFWDSTSNSFAFGLKPMTPTILHMTALFGLKPHGLSIDVLVDYEMKNRKIGVPMRASASKIMRLKTYSGLVMTYQGMADQDQEHMMFLIFWLNKFIFLHAEEGVKTEYLHLAEALHNESNLVTAPFMLASLYHCLHQITISAFNLNVCGPI
ncbi:unnamed protein product [Prunus armeniaca]